MSIESSELQADPKHANQITLVALLRNRATHVQAFPVLELSLNDTEDKVLARRLFKPADYLPATESEAAGLRPNRELSIRLKLDTTDLRPQADGVSVGAVLSSVVPPISSLSLRHRVNMLVDI